MSVVHLTFLFILDNYLSLQKQLLEKYNAKLVFGDSFLNSIKNFSLVEKSATFPTICPKRIVITIAMTTFKQLIELFCLFIFLVSNSVQV